MPALRIKLPDSREVTHVLGGERITVGRRPDNTIQILHGSVSGYHAELIAVNGHYRLHDLQSTNLTFVNGEPVTDFHLHSACEIAFGTIECKFDTEAPSTEAPLSSEQLEREIAFLRGENSELRGSLHSLQRRVDILNSARLVTGRSDSGPVNTAADSFKIVAQERNDLRHQNIGLKLELDKTREELALTVRERDAARQTAELLQSERIDLQRELASIKEKKGTQKIDTAAKPEKPDSAQATASFAGASASTQKLPIAVPPGLESIPPQLRKLRAALDRLATAANDLPARAEARAAAALLLEKAAVMGEHAFVRLLRWADDLLRDLQETPSVRPACVRTLIQAAELLGRFLEPRLLAAAQDLSSASVLAVDDDAELLGSVLATLQLAEIQSVGCGSGEEALGHLEKQKFDVVLADVALPGMDGTAFCAKMREVAAYRKVPVIFLTVTDTLDQRAESSLSGGNDFIGKPFNIFELALKVQTWIFKNQLGML